MRRDAAWQWQKAMGQTRSMCNKQLTRDCGIRGCRQAKQHTIPSPCPAHYPPRVQGCTQHTPQVALGVRALLEVAKHLHQRQVGGGQISRATDEARQHGCQCVEHDLAVLASCQALVLGGVARQGLLPASGQLVAAGGEWCSQCSSGGSTDKLNKDGGRVPGMQKQSKSKWPSCCQSGGQAGVLWVQRRVQWAQQFMG